MPPLNSLSKSLNLHHGIYSRTNGDNGNSSGHESLNGNSNGLSTEILPSNYRPFRSVTHSNSLLRNMNALREDSRFCDVEIVAGQQVLKAHRIILSASSAYFEAMFRPELGLSEGKQKSVILYSIDPSILRMLLDYIYTGEIHITQSIVQELLAAADMIQLLDVVEACCDFLCRELHPSNALGILRFAEAHHCEELKQSALNFIHTNFSQVVLEEELLEIPESLLMRLLCSEHLHVDTETQVFQAALRWINHDIVKRRQYIFGIINQIRFTLVPIKLIEQAAMECTDSSIKIALKSVYRDLKTKSNKLVQLTVGPRLGAKKSVFIIGGSKRESAASWNPVDCIFDTVVKYDTYLNEWNDASPMNTGRILPGVETIAGKIYVFGGERGSQILANGEVYDPQTNKWSVVSPMIVPRCEFGMCSFGGTLWAIGGWIGDDICDSIESYDPVKDKWTFIGYMPKPRFSMGVVSFEGLIYVVGGCTTSSRHLRDLVSYNPITQEWTQLSSMQIARCQMGVAILGRYLYVVGGNDHSQEVQRTVERYSFDTDVWEMVAPMRVERASPAVASANGYLYAVGGDQDCEVNFFRAQITITSVERYDPLNDSWKDCPDLPMSRSEAGAVVI